MMMLVMMLQPVIFFLSRFFLFFSFHKNPKIQILFLHLSRKDQRSLARKICENKNQEQTFTQTLHLHTHSYTQKG